MQHVSLYLESLAVHGVAVEKWLTAGRMQGCGHAFCRML